MSATHLTLSLAQYDFPVGATAANAERVAALAAEARDREHADLVVFPELTLAGYPPDDLLLRTGFLRQQQAASDALNADVRGIEVLYGAALKDGGPTPDDPLVAHGLRNRLVWLHADGRVSSFDKRELPNYSVFDDKRYYTPGSGVCVREVQGVKVGVMICEDSWFPTVAAECKAAGAELLVITNASPYCEGKEAQRLANLRQRVRETGLPLIAHNLIGGHDDVVYDGGAIALNPDGSLAALSPRFEDGLYTLRWNRQTRHFETPAWHRLPDDDETGTTYRALVRATRDYVEKNGFPGVLLGLSGGIDSALTLAIAVDALGPERVQAYLLPSRYTAELSNTGAQQQARAMGVRHAILSIEGPFRAFLDTLAPSFAGRPVDLAEENLQSRCRGVLLMALSNKLGLMLLTTGNKSEVAVGYATIYGDMCGGFAPLKDVYKTRVYALSRWRNAAGPFPVIPEAVIERAPSAELRENQTDQDSLPPYDLLDAILERFVEREQSEEEIVAAGFDAATVRRVAQLVLRNEYKRRQSAPGPRVTPKAFGRERRYPITSGYR